MAETTINHAEIVNVDTDGNQQVIYPKTTGDDVSISPIEGNSASTALGSEDKSLNNLINKLGSNAFNSTSIPAVINELTDTSTTNALSAYQGGVLDAKTVNTYIHSSTNTLSGNGNIGIFKAISTQEDVSTFKVNGTSCTVTCGANTTISITEHSYYNFIIDGNTINFTSTSSSSSDLGITVVGGTTRPSSPSNTTIWLNTDTTIGEYILTSVSGIPTTRIDGSALQEGDVYVSYNTNVTSMYINQNDQIIVYIANVYQYINNVFVYQSYDIYTSDAWCNGLTEVSFYPCSIDDITSVNISNSSINQTINDDGTYYATMSWGGATYATSGNGYMAIMVGEPININGFTKLKATLQVGCYCHASISKSYGIKMEIGDTLVSGYVSSSGTNYSYISLSPDDEMVDVELDITGISGTCYVQFYLSQYYNWSGTYGAQRAYSMLTLSSLYLS